MRVELTPKLSDRAAFMRSATAGATPVTYERVATKAERQPTDRIPNIASNGVREQSSPASTRSARYSSGAFKRSATTRDTVAEAASPPAMTDDPTILLIEF